MKNGIIVCSPKSLYKNIGDYIQSVAAEQFCDYVDYYIERETMNTFKADDKVNVIMNGWFMWRPETLPPAESINPLIISFHVVPRVAERVLRKETIPWFKKYQPIGARDIDTMKLFRRHGIESYFSGCLTLTLGNTYKKDKTKMGGAIFVDPYYPIAGMKNTLYGLAGYIRSFWNLAKNFYIARKFFRQFAVESRTIFRFISPTFERIYCAANFYECYKNAFADELILNAEYITHNIDVSLYNGNAEWMEAARTLVQRYANASLVVTSRIHCGLPCLGVETPCIFVMSNALVDGSHRSGGRFGGLQDLFHMTKCTQKGIIGVTEEIKTLLAKGRLSNPQSVSVRTEYRSLRDKLNETVTDWIKKNK